MIKMKSLLSLYRMNEAPERMMSRQELENFLPGALVSFDRDVGDAAQQGVTFMLNREDDSIFANTKGGGWWKLDDAGIMGPTSDNVGRWQRVRKPGSEREPTVTRYYEVDSGNFDDESEAENEFGIQLEFGFIDPTSFGGNSVVSVTGKASDVRRFFYSCVDRGGEVPAENVQPYNGD